MSHQGLRRVDIHGIAFDTLDQPGVIQQILDSRNKDQGGWVVTPNVDIMRQVHADPQLGDLLRSASLVLVDGAPIVWAGKLAGSPRVPRVAGASIVQPLAVAAAQAGVPVLLLGGRPGAGAKAARRLREEVPGLQVSEHCPPYGFERDLERWLDVVCAVRECGGGVVFCGFGFPKQEHLMAEMSVLFPNTWFLGIGGSIDFLGGDVPRAPMWVQRIGFEWAFRLLVEPRRLARRYIRDGIPFAVRMFGWAARQRLGMRPDAPGVAAPATSGAPAVESSATAPVRIPEPRQPEVAPGLVVERIDLDRRTVTVVIDGTRSIEITFSDYRAAVSTGRLPRSSAVPAALEAASAPAT